MYKNYESYILYLFTYTNMFFVEIRTKYKKDLCTSEIMSSLAPSTFSLIFLNSFELCGKSFLQNKYLRTHLKYSSDIY